MISTAYSIPTLAFLLMLQSALALPAAALGQDQLVELPVTIGDGDDREVSVLLDQNHLKLATIILRRGTVLPTHSAPVPATIQVVLGAGVIHVAGEPVEVSKGSIIVLAAGEQHDVVPEPESDMLLLVHYLRTAAVREAGDSAHDHQP